MLYKILVAEDDIVVKRSLAIFLGKSSDEYDFEVVEAKDGVEALELYEAERPDMIFTDHSMPEMFGDDVVRRIRDPNGYNDHRTRICMLSAGTISEGAAIAAGADDFLGKPFGKADVIAIRDRYAEELDT
ncbi:MAG: response regulator [Candidatus Aenigmarchaeota archaeon]|nr:response regulator [Candidatus Aenigmarchaeota archaeon]